MESDLKVIRQLTEHNYSGWLIDIRALLRRKSLWQYTQTPNPEDEVKKAHETWEDRATQAADWLTHTITPAVKAKLTDAEFNNGYLMLQRLAKILQPSTDLEFMRLFREYFSMKLIDFSSVSAFLDHVKRIEERIDATKVQFTGDKRTLLCLTMALPEHLRSIAQIWHLTPNITAEQARQMLLEEERRNQAENPKDSQAFAGRFGKQSRPERPVLQCSGCGRKGHTTDFCWDLHPELRKKKDTQQQERINNRSYLARFDPFDPYKDQLEGLGATAAY